MRIHKFFGTAISCLGLILIGPCQAENLPTLDIGIDRSASYGSYRTFIDQSISALQKALKKDYLLKVEELDLPSLSASIQRNRLDLVIAPASFSRRSILQGAREIASAVGVDIHNPNKSQGAVYLTRLETQTPNGLLSLKGKRVVTSKEFQLQGMDNVISHLALKDVREPDKFFSAVDYRNPDTGEILSSLKHGDADLAVLPLCALEYYSKNHSVDTSWMKVVDARLDPDVDCVHSSLLYPGLTILSLPSLSPTTSKTITQTLLAMKPVNGISWDIATDFKNLDLVLYSLDRDAWVEQRSWNLSKFLQKYWQWLLIGLAGLVFLALHSVWTEFLVRKRTDALRRALTRQRQLQQEAELSNRKFEKLQKISTIGQMSSLFAHELRQPLNAITCYAHGLKTFIKSDKKDPMVETGLSGIQEEAQKASAIIEKVRDYVRSKSQRRTRQDWAKLIDRSVLDFKKTSLGSLKINWSGHPSVNILADELEMELIVTNLLKNAAQAQEHVKNPWININLIVNKPLKYAEMTVTDDGPALSDEQFKQIISTGDTTKPEGLGLGLTIVKSLTEAHGGKMFIALTENRSLKITIRIPIEEQEAETGEGR